MGQNVLMIDMPQYHIEYKDEPYGYQGTGKENLKKILYKASNHYCMYCYNRIKIDGNEFGQLEHAIEKTISSKKLTNCVPNIGLACSICNDKYKRIGEKKRIPDKSDIDKFNLNACCNETVCKKPCKAYIMLKRAYLKKECARFIMQPLGVESSD